jgi:hypothetical protein
MAPEPGLRVGVLGFEPQDSVTPRREKECLTSPPATTELGVMDASGLPQLTKSDVPELPKNGRVMHICTEFSVGGRVGISLHPKIFHTVLWKFCHIVSGKWERS